MINIAIIGFGVVGGGITEVLKSNKAAVKRACGDDINVKYILDLREFPDSPYADRVVHDLQIILDDPEVSVICETMGGVNPAYDYSIAAIKSGKSVVTSNKELVAKRGVELNAAAQEAGVSYMFEASVGGGIPEICCMRTSLAADTITEIDGILNGTTNYILTKMKDEGAEFSTALSEAKRLGYAEKDPTADIEGLDAQRKIMILCAVATGMLADEEDVYTEGMTKISPLDMDAAARWGGTVKLLGSARISYDNDGAKKASLYVCPSFVPAKCPLANIDDVYNGIRLQSPVTSDIMLYGRGAGRMPTAGAVVSDVTAIASGTAKNELKMCWQNASEDFVVPFEENEFSYYVRIKTTSADDTLEKARLIFGSVERIDGSIPGYAEFITAPVKEREAAEIFADTSLGKTESRIRLMK